jgi:hypothetical protein
MLLPDKSSTFAGRMRSAKGTRSGASAEAEQTDPLSGFPRRAAPRDLSASEVVVSPGAPLPLKPHLNLVDARRMKRRRFFDPDAIGNLPDEGFRLPLPESAITTPSNT